MTARRGLVAGLAGVAVLVLACGLGPLALKPLPGYDPARAALLPPGTALTTVVLSDGTVLASTAVEVGHAVVRVGLGPQAAEVSRKRVARVVEHRLWLGSDRFGRDLLRLLLEGGRVSLLIAAFGALVALGLGTTVGLVAATCGRLVDATLMRLVDALLAFPVLFLMILAAALLRPGPHLLVLVLGLTSWMGLARLVRGQVLSLRARPFLLAARVAGTRWHRTWRLHYLPNLSGTLAQDTALRLGDLVIAEATLSYLGLGVPPSSPTWGALVAEGHVVLPAGWWLSVFPGLAIAALVISLAVAGDAFQADVRKTTDAPGVPVDVPEENAVGAG